MNASDGAQQATGGALDVERQAAGSSSSNPENNNYGNSQSDGDASAQVDNEGADDAEAPRVVQATKGRVGGEEYLRNPVFKFIETEVPFVGKLVRAFLNVLKKPPLKQLAFLVALSLFVGILLTFLPLKAINYLHGTHWTKVIPLVMALPPVRMILDSIYLFLVRKLKLIYILLKLVIILAIFPLLILYKAFANLSRVRVIVVLTMAPPLLASIFLKIYDFALMLINELKDSINGTFDNNKQYNKKEEKSSLIMWLTSLSFVVLILFAVLARRKYPVLFTFCFDQLQLSSVVMLIIAVAIYVQLSMIVYIDNARAGRSRLSVANLTRQSLSRKSFELSVIVTFACITTLYLAMSMNPGYFARSLLTDHRAIALE